MPLHVMLRALLCPIVGRQPVFPMEVGENVKTPRFCFASEVVCNYPLERVVERLCDLGRLCSLHRTWGPDCYQLRK
jgi:hypothetical protein